ncbi:helix-turn-helix domain-containing protein [Paraliobacillus salinarum]|uniref:helix-turn-helix domain-containing protein n=1 Tax=Paraliobacillus salinarum TaxID=1158996 RepID=UPI0015F57593|nr:helix-turn-helix domain-containing protein [Paraliobacillus salinarum]
MYYLSQYQTFDDVQELNYHVKQHTNIRKYEMNDTQRDVLQFIAQYSVKYAGASHLKTETIAKGIGKSRRTIERAISALVNLGIVEKISTVRIISGGKGANIYRILPFVYQSDESQMSHCREVELATQTSDSNDFKRKESDNFINLLKSITYTYADTPYIRFKAFVEQFVGATEKQLIHRLYGVYLAQTKALRKAYEVDKLIGIAIQALAVTFSRSKQMRLRNLVGYFNGVFGRMLDGLMSELFA